MMQSEHPSPAPRASSGHTTRRTALAATLAAVLAGGSGFMLAEAKSTAPLPAQELNVTAPQPGLADLAESVMPAVVSIVVEGKSGLQRLSIPEFEMPGGEGLHEFFERFMERHQGERDHPRPHARGAGSGFIVDPDGLVVTNHHVVKGAESIQVVLDDGTRLEAKLQGSDPKTDLALLQVEPDQSLPWVSFGDSDRLRPGDWVVAIGNPFGLGGSVTTGIVSARNRNINAGPYDDFLQIDAPINRGNSGGPLFDLQGKVVGVNTAIYSPNGGNIGIGFAIPAQQAQQVIASLKTHGHVQRGWLGVQIQAISEELAESLSLDDRDGALVAAVTPDSPAAKAGVQVGDVIVAFNGERLESMRELPRQVADVAPGMRVDMEVLRKGDNKTLKVTVAEAEATPQNLAQAEAAPEGPRLGVAVAALDEDARKRFDVPEEVKAGALVMQVQPGSAAARAGIEPGDVIRQVNGQTITSPEQVSEALRASDDKKVVILLNRAGNQWFQPVTLS